MRQLKFSQDFKTILDYPKIWTKEEIPDEVRAFIKNKSAQNIISDEKENYYCSKCLHVLDENLFCPNCEIKYEFNKYKDNLIYLGVPVDFENFYYENLYFVYDLNDNDLIFYVIKEEVSYYHELIYFPLKMSDVSILRAFYIKKDKLIDVTNHKEYTYEYLKKTRKVEDLDFVLINDYYQGFLYTANLELLKKTVYKYSKLWLAQKYLEEKTILASFLLYYALWEPSFEYLINNELYSLAFDDVYNLEYDDKMKSLLNKSCEYFNFIKNEELNARELEALKLCLKCDIDLIKFLGHNIYALEDLVNITKINFAKLYKYFKENNLGDDAMYEYYDYLKIAKRLGYNMKDKTILYPLNLKEAHDKVTSDYKKVYMPKIDKNIKKLSQKLKVNKYEEEKYIIYPAPSLNSLVEESKMQCNCVRTYADDYSQNNCQIYFLRDKKNIKKSLVTIEVRKGKVVQMRSKYNEMPSRELTTIIKNWEKRIVII